MHLFGQVLAVDDPSLHILHASEKFRHIFIQHFGVHVIEGMLVIDHDLVFHEELLPEVDGWMDFTRDPRDQFI